MARWLLTHSPYAATATTAPNTISGTPSTCRPQGTPGNGGSNWTTPRPATTRARAVRLQARKVRSLAKVNRGSGSVPSPAGPSGSGSRPSGSASAIRTSQDLRGNLAKKDVGRGGVPPSYCGEQVGGVSQGNAGLPHTTPGVPPGLAV